MQILFCWELTEKPQVTIHEVLRSVLIGFSENLSFRRDNSIFDRLKSEIKTKLSPASMANKIIILAFQLHQCYPSTTYL